MITHESRFMILQCIASAWIALPVVVALCGALLARWTRFDVAAEAKALAEHEAVSAIRTARHAFALAVACERTSARTGETYYATLATSYRRAAVAALALAVGAS